MLAQRPYFPTVPTELQSLLQGEGLTLLGISDAIDAPAFEREYREWLAEGMAGSMEYLENHAPLKYHPSRILPGCASIIFAGVNYYQPRSHDPHTGEGRIARYAWGRDYHRLLGKRLKRVAGALQERYPEEQFKPGTDSTPLAERFYAERAGIGFTGRNTLLISGQYGSWFVIGEILSTLHFTPSEPAEGRHGACPSSCRKCIDVCPTGALMGPHRIDASRCISYLTIEHKGSIPVELRRKMGNWLFGCDLCQEVCPLNVRAEVTSEEDFRHIRAGETRELAEILDIEDEEQFKEKFAGSPLMRAKRRGLVRNACIVAANNGASDLLPRLRELSRDTDEIIAEHAAWAVAELTDGGDGSQEEDTPETEA
jgi:epoxyqueuosine reductase